MTLWITSTVKNQVLKHSWITVAYLNMAGSVVSAKELKNVCPLAVLVTDMKIVTIGRMKEASVVSFKHYVITICCYKYHYVLDSTTNCSNSTRCPNECHKTPRGPICSCPSGYQLNGTTCIGKSCAHIFCFIFLIYSWIICRYRWMLDGSPHVQPTCANKQRGFECSCSSGYTVGSRENRSCVANGEWIVGRKVYNVYISSFFNVYRARSNAANYHRSRYSLLLSAF